jgi:hypothetical protein
MIWIRMPIFRAREGPLVLAGQCQQLASLLGIVYAPPVHFQSDRHTSSPPQCLLVRSKSVFLGIGGQNEDGGESMEQGASHYS